MKILIAHNSYQQPGGEDIVASAEAELLREHGHQVVWYRRHNDELRKNRGLRKLSAAINTVWATDSYREIRKLIEGERPDVAHFHNTFPLISPAAYFACANADVPVVQTLHNYRLLCPGATFFRNGKVCEECLGSRFALAGVLHRCYQGSASASGAIAAMLATHRLLGSWQSKVSCYIALSEFARNKFIQGGLPSESIRVKPNFVCPDPRPKNNGGSYALFAGRLSEEKGQGVLLEAWRQLSTPVPLLIAGEGTMRDDVASMVERFGNGTVKLLGQLVRNDIIALMKMSRFLVFPSVCYEGFPVSFAEAFACALPVIASRLGTMAEIISDGRTGLQFNPGDPEDLASRVDWAWNHPQEMESMGQAGRFEYEAKYTPQRNYETLMSIYDSVIQPQRNASVIDPHLGGDLHAA